MVGKLLPGYRLLPASAIVTYIMLQTMKRVICCYATFCFPLLRVYTVCYAVLCFSVQCLANRTEIQNGKISAHMLELFPG